MSVQESPVEAWVDGGLLQGWGHWVQQRVHGTFWRRSPLSSLPPPQFGLRSNNREGTQPCPPTENWIKDLLSMVPPNRTRPSFLLSQSLPSGRFLWVSYPFPSEGRQNENHSHRKLTNLITWNTALSNSMKLWVMPHKATQDTQVIMESSDKMWSTGERNGKPLQYSCLENPMKSMKSKKIGHWKMNSSGQ